LISSIPDLGSLAFADPEAYPELHYAMNLNPDDLVCISRQGLEFGEASVGDVVELLRAGFLLPTDEFWTAANPERRPLSELESAPSGVSHGWLQRAKTSVVTATGAVVKGAGHIRSKVSTTIREGPTQIGAIATKVLEDYVPTLRERIAAQMKATVQTTQAALRDEVFLRKLFGAVYDCLPKPVYRFVSEHAFIEYCLKHRRKLLDDPAVPLDSPR
jgi:hypothetical protein